MNESEEVVEKKKQMPKAEDIKYHIHPTYFFDYDDEENTWEIEINLPGVKKKNVSFKVLDDAFQLLAVRDQALYHLEESLPCLIDRKSVEGKYENGLLKIKGKIKNPMEDAVKIEL